MLDTLLSLIGRRRVVPVSPEHFSLRLPPIDTPDMIPAVADAPDLESIAGVGCTIEYVDAIR